MKIIDGLRDQRQLGQLILQITNCSVRGVRGAARRAFIQRHSYQPQTSARFLYSM